MYLPYLITKQLWFFGIILTFICDHRTQYAGIRGVVVLSYSKETECGSLVTSLCTAPMFVNDTAHMMAILRR